MRAVKSAAIASDGNSDSAAAAMRTRKVLSPLFALELLLG